MNTVMSRDVTSIAIRKHFGPNMELEIVGSIGSGDHKMTLYLARTGSEVIEANGDPCWEGEAGFAEVREKIINS